MDIESLVRHIRKVAGESEDSQPSTLYHYTTIEVLDKLLEEGNGDLRCTYFRDLNDSAEFKAGYEYFADYCKRHDFGGDGEKVLRDLQGIWHKLQTLYLEAPWVMSFSTERDSLYQWVAYTDRQKGGVAIGFDRIRLENAVKKSAERNGLEVMLLPCLYVDRGKKKKTDSDVAVIDKLDDLISFFIEKIDEKSPDWVQELGTAILIFSSIVKDKAFCAEHEWRLVVITRDRLSCKDAEVIAGKARLPLGLREAGKRKVGELVSEIQRSPHGDQKRLMHSILFPKCSDANLTYKIAYSDLPYKGEKT